MKTHIAISLVLVAVILLSVTIFVQAGGPMVWQFSPTVRVNNDAGSNWQWSPALTLRGKDKLYAAWTLDNNRVGNAATSQIEFAKSPNGETWGGSKPVTEESIGLVQHTPDLAIDGKNLHLVWSHFPEIHYARSTDEGETWTTPTPIKQFSGDLQVSPRIFARQGAAHVVWSGAGSDWRRTSIWYAATTDGSTWQTNQVASSDQWEWYFNNPDVVVTGQGIYVVWQWDIPGKCQVYYSVSYDSGQNWTEPKPISTTKKAHLAPKLAADGDTVYAVWATQPNSIMFSSSINNGLTWSEPLTVAEGPRAYDANITTADGRIFVSYVSGTTAEQEAITIIESDDGGQTWQVVGHPDKPTTVTSGIAGHQIAATKKEVYVVWSQWAGDETQYDVFFASAHQLHRAFLPAIERGLVTPTTD